MEKTLENIGPILDVGAVENIYSRLDSFQNTIDLDCSDTTSATGDGLIALLQLWRDIQPLELTICVYNANSDFRAILRSLNVDSIVSFKNE